MISQSNDRQRSRSVAELGSAASSRRPCRHFWAARRCPDRRLLSPGLKPHGSPPIAPFVVLALTAGVHRQVVRRIWEYIKEHQLQNPSVSLLSM